jgi:tRNA (guanine37-N1)-methyltransferase
MLIETLSVFPDVFAPYFSTSIMGRAHDKGLVDFVAHDLRDWTHDRHRTVDDAPFGGGQGMLMKPAPFFEAVGDISSGDPRPAHVVFFTPCGHRFDQATAERLSHEERLLFVCGHYEGMDERVYELADECLSLGDYVLTGGELAAMVVSDSVVRLLPGALGDEMSARDESFSDGLLEYAQYTRPADYDGRTVPEVLLSGDHAAVDAWRRRSALVRTARLRPDLLAGQDLTREEQDLVERVACEGTDTSQRGEITPDDNDTAARPSD